MIDTSATRAHRTFVPAAGLDLLLPFYDAMTRLLGARALFDRLIRQADLEPGMHVLDVGCGTGTLLRLLADFEPQVTATGLDPDLKALARARRKLRTVKCDIALDLGYADTLPYGAGVFDRVFSTLMFHHLDERTKVATLREIRRVLKPGGALLLLDFGGRRHRRGSSARLQARAHPGPAPITDDGISAMMHDAGFDDIVELGRHRTPLGNIVWYRGRQPPEDTEAC